jgi:hypothetical protein
VGRAILPADTISIVSSRLEGGRRPRHNASHNDFRKSLSSHILLSSKKLGQITSTGGHRSRTVSAALYGTFQSGDASTQDL